MDRDDGLDIRGDELETKFGFLTDSLDSYYDTYEDFYMDHRLKDRKFRCPKA